jgi:type IV pilus assembly protein PilW
MATLAQSRIHGRSRQRGFGIVEIMVGVLIGMLVILAVYNVLASAEGYRRTTMAAADTQVSGLLTEFLLTRDISNGGSSIASAQKELTQCADAALRPIPVLITDGGPDVSDSFVVFSGGPSRIVHAVNLLTSAPAGTNSLKVKSPTGFDPAFCTAASPCLLLLMQGANCQLLRATSAPDGVTVGNMILTTIGNLAQSYDSSGKVMNLGQNGTAQRTRYDVASNVLRSQDLLTLPGPNPVNPVASNVLLMKVQYGVDTSGTLDGTVDCWTSAAAGSPCIGGDYRDTAVQNFTQQQLQRIVAIRVGIVVQSDEFAGKEITSDQTVHLFNCSLDTDADCQGRISVTLPKNWRYRTYETVIPLRNAVWNGP